MPDVKWKCKLEPPSRCWSTCRRLLSEGFEHQKAMRPRGFVKAVYKMAERCMSRPDQSRVTERIYAKEARLTKVRGDQQSPLSCTNFAWYTPNRASFERLQSERESLPVRLLRTRLWQNRLFNALSWHAIRFLCGQCSSGNSLPTSCQILSAKLPLSISFRTIESL